MPIVCGDPADASTYFGGYDKAAVSPISCPDNVAFDSAGNLWISTDGNALRLRQAGRGGHLAPRRRPGGQLTHRSARPGSPAAPVQRSA
ncbi:alkaline phosphatase PhoX [Paractinoplanes toevensis]|uniref:alkaline phosphatase PhoX n=1 Tax=Paractinoplanes toevensis TaxID=571911 RepID=UPI0034DB6297